MGGVVGGGGVGGGADGFDPCAGFVNADTLVEPPPHPLTTRRAPTKIATTRILLEFDLLEIRTLHLRDCMRLRVDLLWLNQASTYY